MSKYLDGLELQRSGYQTLNLEFMSIWHRGRSLAGFTYQHLVECTYSEELYKGHWLIICKETWSITPILDVLGQPIRDSMNAELKGVRGTPELVTDYRAWAWRDGVEKDSDTNIQWLGLLRNVMVSNKLETTVKKAKARIDLEDLMAQQRDRLVELSREVLSNSEVPFNLSVGGVAFIHAYSRWRAGVVVATQGRRFVVAYVVPSNSRDLRYKTLTLSAIRVGASS